MQKILRKAAASLSTTGKIDKDQMHNYFMSGIYFFYFKRQSIIVALIQCNPANQKQNTSGPFLGFISPVIGFFFAILTKP